MKKPALFCVQRRAFLGMSRRGWGFGQVSSFSSWITLERHPSQEEAVERAKTLSQGLYQTRVRLRRSIVWKSEN